MSSFSEKIATLQSIYRSQHDLSNKLAGASFADDRGYLSEAEKIEFQQIQEQYSQQEKVEQTLREEIRAEFPEAYEQHLKTLQTKLLQLQKYFQSLKGELEFRQSFNKTLCESLLSDLSKLIQNKKTNYALNWLFDVSESLLEEYKNI